MEVSYSPLKGFRLFSLTFLTPSNTELLDARGAAASLYKSKSIHNFNGLSRQYCLQMVDIIQKLCYCVGCKIVMYIEITYTIREFTLAKHLIQAIILRFLSKCLFI